MIIIFYWNEKLNIFLFKLAKKIYKIISQPFQRIFVVAFAARRSALCRTFAIKFSSFHSTHAEYISSDIEAHPFQKPIKIIGRNKTKNCDEARVSRCTRSEWYIEVRVKAISTVITVAQFDNARNVITRKNIVGFKNLRRYLRYIEFHCVVAKISRQTPARPPKKIIFTSFALKSPSSTALFRQRENERERLGNHVNGTICTVNRFVATISRGRHRHS